VYYNVWSISARELMWIYLANMKSREDTARSRLVIGRKLSRNLSNLVDAF
jgi:hypothetical protein